VEGGWGGWRGRVGGLTIPVDTGDQVVCTVHGPERCSQQPRPYHEENRRQVEQFGTTCHPINAPQWLHRVCDGPAWLDRVSKKPSVKANLLIYINCVKVSRQCLSVAIIISNKLDFNSCAYMAGFPKSSHI